MSKRPPLGTTGKFVLADKRNRARQLLDCEQPQHDCRDLLSLIGKNSSLVVPSCGRQGTPSCNKRYAANVASAEKACLNVNLLIAGVSTDIRVHGITNVAEKIVFDGDGGKPKPPTSELDVVDEESDSGTEDDADANESSGSSGSSSGRARMRSEHTARDAKALVTLPVPDVIVKVVPDFSLAALIHTVALSMIKRALGNFALIAIASHIWLAPKILSSKIRSIWNLL